MTIKLKFICPKCMSDKLIEQIDYHYDPALNECVIGSDDSATYFCEKCHSDIEPHLVDFTLQEPKNA